MFPAPAGMNRDEQDKNYWRNMFPAPAGMNRHNRPLSPSPRNVPRTRGDEPTPFRVQVLS